MAESRTDEELMAAYQAGDARAFDELYLRYSPRVYGYLGRRLSERSERDDVFQAVFLKLHQSRHRYSPALPFAPWLFTVCRSVLTDHFRSRPAPLVGEAPEETAAPSGDALELSEKASALPEAQQKALLLRYGDGLDFSEIAKRLGTNPGNVRQLVSRAVRKLRGKP